MREGPENKRTERWLYDWVSRDSRAIVFLRGRYEIRQFRHSDRDGAPRKILHSRAVCAHLPYAPDRIRTCDLRFRSLDVSSRLLTCSAPRWRLHHQAPPGPVPPRE